MYSENANGASYGPIFEELGVARSLLPMNIKPRLWAELSGGGADLSDPLQNIRAGVVLIRRIMDRIQQPSVAKVGTLYNSLAKESVSEFGARVAKVYESQLWEKAPLRFTIPDIDNDPIVKDMRAEIQRHRQRILDRLPAE